MILLVFGWMAIGSAFIVGGWFRQGWRNRFPLSVYNAALMMSVGFDLHSIGFFVMLSGRIWQVLSGGAQLGIESPIYWLGAAMVVAGKTFFVWVAALKEGRSYSRVFIWSYWAVMALWAAFAIFWQGFFG